MPQIIRTLEESLAGQGLVDAALALSRTSPSPVLSPWQSAYTGLLRAASARGLGRLLMGTGGDDLLNVDPTYGADRLAALDLRGLWRYCRACQRTSPFSAARVVRGVLWDHAARPELIRLGRIGLERVSPSVLAWARRRRHRRAVPGWAAPRDRHLAARLDDRLLTAEPTPTAPGERSYVRTLRGLTQAPLALLERDQSHAWARNLGFTFLFPFFDRDLAALTLRIPPEALIAGGRHKTPLRRLVAARLPAVRMRDKKVDFNRAVHAVLRPEGRRAWRGFGGPEMLADLGLVDADRLRRFMDDYFERRHDGWLHIWLALSTEMWLRARSTRSAAPSEQEALA
jgi:asparagine synthetase B (glutamine-hydrolysing)